jgi:hypothetical protein
MYRIHDGNGDCNSSCDQSITDHDERERAEVQTGNYFQRTIAVLATQFTTLLGNLHWTTNFVGFLLL